jgi:hypothetical protein
MPLPSLGSGGGIVSHAFTTHRPGLPSETNHMILKGVIAWD